MSVVIIACFVALLYSMWLIGRSRTGTEAYQ